MSTRINSLYSFLISTLRCFLALLRSVFWFIILLPLYLFYCSDILFFMLNSISLFSCARSLWSELIVRFLSFAVRNLIDIDFIAYSTTFIIGVLSFVFFCHFIHLPCWAQPASKYYDFSVAWLNFCTVPFLY
jgi:hypothetical protein